jgi:sigma-B regulation protein RsbU (phosphoserine phosphatase)
MIYCSLSRRNVEPPYYLITRSSRFAEEFNPWTQRDRLPKLAGGLFGEIIYANRPTIIENLPARLSPDDPAHFYLDGFELLFALPQYDGGESLNATVMLLPPGREFDRTVIPMMHWHAGLFGRGTTNSCCGISLVPRWQSSIENWRWLVISSARCCPATCRRSRGSSWRPIT